jgi:hypothetical protein
LYPSILLELQCGPSYAGSGKDEPPEVAGPRFDFFCIRAKGTGRPRRCLNLRAIRTR